METERLCFPKFFVRHLEHNGVRTRPRVGETGVQNCALTFISCEKITEESIFHFSSAKYG